MNLSAVGRTRLRVGEGIVGLCAAQGAVMNLPDAQNHPSFAYRPETGEEPFASMLAVPVRRSGRVLGVLVVQNRMPRHFTGQEVDELETVAMLLAEMLPVTGGAEATGEGLPGTVPRVFSGSTLMTGIAIGPVVLHGTRMTGIKLLADDPAREMQRLNEAADRMQRGIDDLLAGVPTDAAASRDVLEAYRLIAADQGWLRRVGDVIKSGLTAEAAVGRVATELHDRMRRISDPYLRERLADLEDLANRLLTALMGDLPRRLPRTAPSCSLAVWGRRNCWNGTPAASPASPSRKPAHPVTPPFSPALWEFRPSGAPAECWIPPSLVTKR